MCNECGFSKCPDGCPNAPEQVLICPVCGQAIELYIYTQDREIIGCDQCVERKLAE